MSRYYLLIEYLPKSVDECLLAGRCIATMHGFLRVREELKNLIGVAFPQWSETSIGKSIAFVANDKNALIGLAYQEYFSMMKKEQLFKIHEVHAVPDDAREVRFIRNCVIDKIFIGSKKRRMKRAIKKKGAEAENYNFTIKEDREFELFHSIPMSSKSSEQQFMLHIQKDTSEQFIEPNFNGYGFATPKDRRGTVPDLSYTLL